MEYDYIIVGAGSSGAVLANRLSADPGIRVCLIEAGPEDRHPLIHIPLGLIGLMKNPRVNWMFTSTAQKNLNNRQIPIPRGKVLGGSSSINGMIYIRGHRQDYDSWAASGCAGWSYDEVLPYFRKSESNADETLDENLHGKEGLLSVCNLKSPNTMNEVFVDAAEQLQYGRCRDFNVAEPEGVGNYQVTQKNGKRHSSAAAFLVPARNRKNLDVRVECEVTNLIIDKSKVTGIQVRTRDGAKHFLKSRYEVILSAGAIGSPDILLRSGIGPGAEIKNLDLEVKKNIPGVGKNLHDHVDIMLIAECASTASFGISFRAMPRLMVDGLRWMFGNSGMLSSNMVEAGGFIRSAPGIDRPDLQFTFIPGKKSIRGRMVEWGHGVSLHACILRPKSRGSLTRSKPHGPPEIDLGLLTHEDDVNLLVRGAYICREVLAQSPFSAHGLREIHPSEQVLGRKEMEEFVRNNARTIYHPVGTCAMGDNGDAVVNPRLQVHGIAGLRVVDASIMPSIVSGNTNAPCMMIAEKAADMIVADRRAA